MKKVLVEAMYLYCLHHKMKPYIVCDNCPEYLSNYSKDGIITLNLSNNASGHVNFKDDLIQVGASFNGRNFDLEFDINLDVLAIYAFENDKVGLFFQPATSVPTDVQLPKESPKGKSSHLRLVK